MFTFFYAKCLIPLPAYCLVRDHPGQASQTWQHPRITSGAFKKCKCVAQPLGVLTSIFSVQLSHWQLQGGEGIKDVFVDHL